MTDRKKNTDDLQNEEKKDLPPGISDETIDDAEKQIIKEIEKDRSISHEERNAKLKQLARALSDDSMTEWLNKLKNKESTGYLDTTQVESVPKPRPIHKSRPTLESGLTLRPKLTPEPKPTDQGVLSPEQNQQRKSALLILLQDSAQLESKQPKEIRNDNITMSLRNCFQEIENQSFDFSNNCDIKKVVDIIDMIIPKNVSWCPTSWFVFQQEFQQSHLITMALKKKEKSGGDTI